MGPAASGHIESGHGAQRLRHVETVAAAPVTAIVVVIVAVARFRRVEEGLGKRLPSAAAGRVVVIVISPQRTMKRRACTVCPSRQPRCGP
jgi:hypothetical protein